ncbi:MAG: reverse transcriptase domain-containing protein [Xanthobacteraceae bacterium]
MLENYKEHYTSRGKHIFVPNGECDRRAETLIRFAAAIDLPHYFFHYRSGGHVAALHEHRSNRYFFRIDLKNFFYSISRNRVAHMLRQLGFHSAREYAAWSTVRNPYEDAPKYALPIGFKQSPLLASLALWRSAVASSIEEAMERGVIVSVYFDDLIGSATDERELRITYQGILDACTQANLPVNATKLIEPADAIVAFNCSLVHGQSRVTDERIQKFCDELRGPDAEASFIAYCARVLRGNAH